MFGELTYYRLPAMQCSMTLELEMREAPVKHAADHRAWMNIGLIEGSKRIVALTIRLTSSM